MPFDADFPPFTTGSGAQLFWQSVLFGPLGVLVVFAAHGSGSMPSFNRGP